MNNGITRRRYVIGLALGVLASASFQLGTGWLQLAVAQAPFGDGSVVFISDSIIGIVPGQKLRISVGTRQGSHQGFGVWEYQLSNTTNQVLFESDPIELPPGGWRFSDVSRDDLKIEGEPGTARAQVMVRVRIEAPRGAKSSDFIGSLELVDVGTGETVAYWTIEMKQVFVDSIN